jgi:hypothetical protein
MAKRSQLAVGQEWAYSNKRQHQHSAWGGHYKATIESVEPYKANRYGSNIRPSGEGLGVLVSVEEKWRGEIRKTQKVIQLSQLWKPWAEYEVERAEYLGQYKINEEKAKIAKAEKEKFQQEVYRPALKEFFQAIKPFTGEKYVSGYTRIEELPIEVLQAVTKAIQEKAVA